MVLASQLPGQVSFKQDATYGASIHSYFYQQARLAPQCIVFPKSSSDVSRIVKTLARMRAKAAVRGGGHTPIADAANLDNAVTIDLSWMNGVSLTSAHTLGLPSSQDDPNSPIALPAIAKDSSSSAHLFPSSSSLSPNTTEKEASLSAPNTLLAGGGATWGNVYQRLDSTGLISIGGRGTSLGVGGLTTGGWLIPMPNPPSLQCQD